MVISQLCYIKTTIWLIAQPPYMRTLHNNPKKGKVKTLCLVPHCMEALIPKYGHQSGPIRDRAFTAEVGKCTVWTKHLWYTEASLQPSPCPWRDGYNQVILEVPSNPGLSVTPYWARALVRVGGFTGVEFGCRGQQQMTLGTAWSLCYSRSLESTSPLFELQPFQMMGLNNIMNLQAQECEHTPCVCSWYWPVGTQSLNKFLLFQFTSFLKSQAWVLRQTGTKTYVVRDTGTVPSQEKEMDVNWPNVDMKPTSDRNLFSVGCTKVD